jgi:hypothetical protein
VLKHYEIEKLVLELGPEELELISTAQARQMMVNAPKQ